MDTLTTPPVLQLENLPQTNKPNSKKKLFVGLGVLAIIAAAGIFLYSSATSTFKGALVLNLSPKNVNIDRLALPPAPVVEPSPVIADQIPTPNTPQNLSFIDNISLPIAISTPKLALGGDVTPVITGANIYPNPAAAPKNIFNAANLKNEAIIKNNIASVNTPTPVEIQAVPQEIAVNEPVATPDAALPDAATPAAPDAPAVVNNYYGNNSSYGYANRVNELEDELAAIKGGKKTAEQIAAETAANIAAGKDVVVVDPTNTKQAVAVADQSNSAQNVAVAVPAKVAMPAVASQNEEVLHGSAYKKLNAADANAIERAFAENPTQEVKASEPIVRTSSASNAVNGSSMRGDTGPEVLLYPSLIAMADAAYLMLRKKRK